MRIVFFRHGPAGKRDSSRWPDDGVRPLTARGQVKTMIAARGLARLESRVHRVLTSPLKRAEQTAELLNEVLDAKLEVLDSLAPNGASRTVVQHLSELGGGETVVLVGHEPGLGKLAALLAFNSATLELPLRKAGACAVDFDGGLRPGGGRLRWLMTPSGLRRMAGKTRKRS
jgi:phosphohistidine phosphatase